MMSYNNDLLACKSPLDHSAQPEALADAARLASSLARQGTTIRLGLDVPAGFDHRRTRQREVAETLLMRCEHLPAAQALLMKSLYADKRTIREVAQMQGRCERSVRREVRRLSRRMLRPEFAIVVLQGPTWNPTRLRVGEAVYLHGLSMRAASVLLGVSVYSIRMHSAAIRAIADAQRRASTKPRAALRGGAA